MGDGTRVTTEATEQCSKCGLRWPESFFLSENGGKTAWCSLCLSKYRPDPTEPPPAPKPRDSVAIRAQHLRQKYGLTVDEYDGLRAAQGYRCAICGILEDQIKIHRVGRPRKDGQPPAVAARLVVDHCHATGRVRGLLCAGCNSAIGHFGESPEAMLAAVEYLRRD